MRAYINGHTIVAASQSFPVTAIHHKYDSIAVAIVVSPKRSDFVLSAHVPNIHCEFLVFYGFHIESNGWNGLHRLVAFVLQPVKDGGLSSVVKPQDEDSDLLRPKEALEEPA